jgi:hypothetical protein
VRDTLTALYHRYNTLTQSDCPAEQAFATPGELHWSRLATPIDEADHSDAADAAVGAPATPGQAWRECERDEGTGRPLVRTGYLAKQGHLLQRWKLRYFRLLDDRLQFFTEPGGDFLGHILLHESGTMVKPCAGAEPPPPPPPQQPQQQQPPQQQEEEGGKHDRGGVFGTDEVGGVGSEGAAGGGAGGAKHVGSKARPHSFQVFTLSKTTTLAARSEEDMQAWIDTARRCIVVRGAPVAPVPPSGLGAVRRKLAAA